MTIPSSSNLYGVSVGTSTNAFSIPVYSFVDPSASNVKYPIGKEWINQSTNAIWKLASISSSNGILSANWELLGGGTSSYPVTPFVVGPSGQAGYQTIQSAVNAANAAGGGIVLVQPGTYTENLTLYNAVHIMGLNFADAGGGVVIVGVHTPPASGGFVFNNVFLQSSTHIFSSSVAGSAHLIIANAAITVVNGYTFNLLNWTGKLEVFDVNDRASTNDGFVNNTGGAEVAFFNSAVGAGTSNTMTVSGPVSIFGCAVGCPINCVTGSVVYLEENVHLNSITFSNNSTGEIVLCEVDAQITMSSNAAVLIGSTLINTASSPAIAGSGAGTLTLGNITFVSNSSISGSLTITWVPTKNGAITATGNLTFASAGNKIISSSVGTTTSAGANSFGTVTLVGGTATVATTAVTANSIIFLTRTSVGATGANALGMLAVGTITPGTSFVIGALTTASSAALQTTDVSVVGWMIVN